jgi:hypothetical protein
VLDSLELDQLEADDANGVEEAHESLEGEAADQDGEDMGAGCGMPPASAEMPDQFLSTLHSNINTNEDVHSALGTSERLASLQGEDRSKHVDAADPTRSKGYKKSSTAAPWSSTSSVIEDEDEEEDALRLDAIADEEPNAIPNPALEHKNIWTALGVKPGASDEEILAGARQALSLWVPQAPTLP